MEKRKHWKMAQVALLILMVMLLSFVLTACKKGEKDKLDWTPNDTTQILSLKVDRQADGDKKKLVISNEGDIFAEGIKKNYFKITAFNKAEPTEQTTKSTDKEITDISFVRDSAKQISISLPASDGNFWGYNVVVHSKATIANKFGEGYYFTTVYEDLTPSYGVKINGKISTAKVNPIITLTLENTTATATINSSMVKLIGALSELTVTHISGNGQTVVITTNGQITARDTMAGAVELLPTATASGVTLVANTLIDSVSAWVDESSYKIAANRDFSFDIILGGDTFKDGVTSFSITGNQFLFSVVSISSDRTTATVKTSVGAFELDNALETIKEKILIIEKEQVTSGEKKEVALTASAAETIMSVDYIEQIDATTFKATATLFAKNGKFEALTKTDLTFDGDFYGATIQTLQSHDNRYDVVFTFTKSGIVNIEDCLLSGDLKIASGKLKNLWNTASQKLLCDVFYSAGQNKGAFDAISAFVAANASTFSTISTVGSAVGGVASTAKGIITILELCGVVESTNDKLNSIRQEITTTQDMITNLSSKVDSLGRTLTGSLDTVIAQNYKTIYNTAAANWNNFLAEYVLPLKNVMSDFEMEYKKYMLNYFNSAHTEAKTIYIDIDDKVNLPHPNISGQTVDGKNVKTSNTYKLKSELTNIKGAIGANRGKLPNDYWSTFSTYIKANSGEIVDGVSGTASNIATIDYLQAVQVNAAYSAMTAVTPSRILSAYKNFCYKLAGSVGGSPVSSSTMTPLSYYYQMLSVFYNFYSESKSDMAQTQAWLYSLIAESSGIATMALNFTPAADGTVVTKGYSLAQKELSVNTGAKTEKSGSQYSYVAGDTMSVEYAQTFVEPNITATARLVHPNVDKTYEFPSKFVTADMLATMRNRFSILKSAGVLSSADFGQYMSTTGLMTAKNVNDFVLTEKPQQETIPLDNSLTLNCTSALSTSDYFVEGSSYSIGTSGKLTSEYWTDHYMLKGAGQKLDGSQGITILDAFAYYVESHWYWLRNEFAGFRLTGYGYSDCGRNVTIFALGK